MVLYSWKLSLENQLVTMTDTTNTLRTSAHRDAVSKFLNMQPLVGLMFTRFLDTPAICGVIRLEKGISTPDNSESSFL
jgi:hypothetical protein